MQTYLAFLRGINVGGNSLIKMADLKEALLKGGLLEVRTYIQSGNVIFCSKTTDIDELSAHIKKTIQQNFKMDVDIAVFTKNQWQKIVESAPVWWGRDTEWKHNILILIKPYDIKEVIKAYGQLKPGIEAMEPGDGVVYQSLLFTKFGQTVGGKLAANPIYKKMTIRNYNTATKLATLFD